MAPIYNVLISIFTTIGIYVVLHFVLKKPRINEALKVIKEKERIVKWTELKIHIEDFKKFISEDMKYMFEDLELERWDRYMDLLEASKKVWEECYLFLELYDLDLGNDIIIRIQTILDFFNERFLKRDKEKRLDKNIPYREYYKNFKIELIEDHEYLENEVKEILTEIKKLSK